MSQYKELTGVLAREFNARLTESGCSGNPKPVSDLWDDVNGAIPHQQVKMILGEDMIKRIKRESMNTWKGYIMNTKERGDALLTAYVNKDFETVKTLWCDRIGNPYEHDPIIALHKYKNPSITDVGVGVAVAKSVNATRDYEGEAREKNERNDAKRGLWALGYNEYLCLEYGLTYWSQTENGESISDGLYDSCGISDPRKVLESLKK